MHDEVERLAASIRSESDFAAAARQYSATRSAEDGGRLPGRRWPIFRPRCARSFCRCSRARSASR
ncbi:peptidylprolyl isomerase [Paracoccus cavernae]|uniref:Parvulin-like PPIase n=1 Tax=Paracoccus cavernae TaxID=1571207 RepID=A0ABT8D6P1_9RHOB|nr:peptidylprolyl isomerase [Paracoccus cavernae]